MTDPEDAVKLLGTVNDRLKHILGTRKEIPQCIDSEKPQQTTTAHPPPSFDDDYEKKVYGWGVIVRLEEWLTEVGQVLQKAKTDDERARL